MAESRIQIKTGNNVKDMKKTLNILENTEEDKYDVPPSFRTFILKVYYFFKYSMAA